MKRTTIVMTGLFLALQSAAAFAQTACINFPGGDFGAVAMGDLYARVPKNFTKLPECAMDKDYPEAICAWLDPKTGIEYDGAQGMIIRKQIDISDKNQNPALPFGLKPQDNVQAAQKKIKAIKGAPGLRVSKTGTGATRIETACLKGSKVEMMKIQMEFGPKGLKTLSLILPMGEETPDPGKPNRPLFNK